ncbi:hypothetical protein JHK85_012922 [Glycine max]|nr:hypothetical protein JHK85_012922 [Glycine max]KAG5057586.1 hypothetical protein JHK86_012582 [Glycine max]
MKLKRRTLGPIKLKAEDIESYETRKEEVKSYETKRRTLSHMKLKGRTLSPMKGKMEDVEKQGCKRVRVCMTILPTTWGSPRGLPHSGPCSRGKISRGDGDGDEKPPTANSGTGTGTMLPAPQGPRIPTVFTLFTSSSFLLHRSFFIVRFSRELVEAFVAPFSSSSRTMHFWVSQLQIVLPILFDAEDVSLHLDGSMKT